MGTRVLLDVRNLASEEDIRHYSRISAETSGRKPSGKRENRANDTVKV